MLQFVFIGLAVLLSRVDTAKILFFNGYGEGSHFTVAVDIAKELVARNHSVTFIISNAYRHRTEDPVNSKLFNFEVFEHSLPLDNVRYRMAGMTEAAFEDRLLQYQLANIDQLVNETVQDCIDLLDNKDVMKRILEANFDLTFYDPVWPCSAILADMVGHLYVALSPPSFLAAHYRLYGGQTNPAIIPELGSGLPLQMTFFQRMKNTAWAWFNDAMLYFFCDTPYRGQPGVPTAQSEKGVLKIFEETSLWFINSHPVIDIPVPLMPNVIAAPGISTKPARPLDEDLGAFVQTADDNGIIVFSLGGYVTHMPEDKLDIFKLAFGKLRQKIIWQWKGEDPPVNLPPNIRTMKWIPQNDLLGTLFMAQKVFRELGHHRPNCDSLHHGSPFAQGHNKTKLFIYQGGNNGLYEAIYHAVPLVILPIIGDQSDVAQRVQDRGIGRRLNVKSLTSEKLLESINEVLHTPSYKQNMDRVSSIFHDRPMKSTELIAFWVDHLLKYGGDHLRSPVHDLNFIELYMLDVYGVLVTGLSLATYVCYVVTRLIFGLCVSCCKTIKSKED